MILGFELNEKLKDTLVVEFSAFEGISQFFKKGVPLIPEPFLETTVRWDKDVDEEIFSKALEFIILSKKEINKIAEMTEPEFELKLGHPQIIWAIFNLENNDTIKG
jgi:hypothetical protein